MSKNVEKISARVTKNVKSIETLTVERMAFFRGRSPEEPFKNKSFQLSNKMLDTILLL